MIAFRDGGHDFVEVVAASYTQGVSLRSRRAWGAVATAMVTPSQGMEHAVGLQLVEITVALQVAWWPDLADVSLPDDLLFARLAGMDLATTALNFSASSSTVSHHGSPTWRVTWTSRPPMLQRREVDMALRTRRVECGVRSSTYILGLYCWSMYMEKNRQPLIHASFHSFALHYWRWHFPISLCCNKPAACIVNGFFI